ncbi:MAG: TonB C-terminal domain-containing protein [Elusimicrobia bacterium]|nr:TonB C-terminal domain-containing protein [Elusimicrobiota bacterium]
MRQYLLYSSSAHFIILLLLLFAANGSFSTKKKAVYYIDFIGPSKIMNANVSPRNTIKKIPTPSIEKKEDKPIQKSTEEEKKEEISMPLPKPSMLEKADALFFSDKKDLKETVIENSSEATNGIVADFSDFPYPWYISLVRNALSNQWMTKMPSSGDMSAVIFFNIIRDGTVKNLKVEKSSGNRLFDNAALSSVENAMPFEVLPDDFTEKKLSVHVEFKTME